MVGINLTWGIFFWGESTFFEVLHECKTSCSNPRSIFLRIHQPLGGAGGQAADIEIQVRGGGWRFIRIQRFMKAWLLFRKLTCPLKKDHFKRTCHFPSIIFEGAMLVFGGCNPKSICLGGLDVVEHLPKKTQFDLKFYGNLYLQLVPRRKRFYS